MPRARKPCSTPSCTQLIPAGQSRCAACKAQAEQRRGTARQRGYDTSHERRFRRGVLKRDRTCVCTDTAHGHGAQCIQPSTVADHWPLSRRELVAQGLDADDPARGRGLCASCHSKATIKLQPGGYTQ